MKSLSIDSESATGVSQDSRLIPRTVWIYWHQGVENSPEIVRRCIDSWRSMNPNWEVIVLDSKTLSQRIELKHRESILENLDLAHQSDLIRLWLLEEYGGVWADATTLCVCPLDKWIDDHSMSGLFVFRDPAPDRIMANWFIAAIKGCGIISSLERALVEYWVTHKFTKSAEMSKFRKRCRKKIGRLLNQRSSTTKYWFNPFVSRVLRVYPYFVFHYMFERVVNSESSNQITWENTTKRAADAPLRVVKDIGLLSEVTGDLKEEISKLNVPLHKLSWKFDERDYNSNTVLHYLLTHCERY